MPTFKAEIQNKRRDGTYNVRIRVTHNREVRRFSTNLFVTEHEVTKRGKIKNTQVLDISEDIVSKCRAICNGFGMEILEMPIDALVDKLKYRLTGGDTFRLDFIEYAQGKIPGLSEGTARIYKAAINTLRRYAGNALDISDITVAFLRGFEVFIEKDPSRRGSNRKDVKEAPKRTKGNRAVSLYMSCIRKLYNQAKDEYNDEDRGIINIPYSPFDRFKVKASVTTKKRAIPVDKIQAIINLPYVKEVSKRKKENIAKDCFLLSFIFIGMNSADLFNAPPAKDNVLTYNRKKTETRRDDRAEMRVRLESPAAFLLDKYKDPYGKRMFNFYLLYANEKSFNRAINEGLKRVGEVIGVEDLTYYAARHSWATIARSAAVGIDKATVHEALNHVDKEMRVTDIYIDRDWSVIWNANKKVLDLFDWSELELLYLL